MGAPAAVPGSSSLALQVVNVVAKAVWPCAPAIAARRRNPERESATTDNEGIAGARGRLCGDLTDR